MAAKTGMAGITVVGIGPGSLFDMTPRARAAIERAQVVAGYTTYIRLIEPLLADKEVIGTGIHVRSNDACLFCKNEVRQEVVDNLTHKRILRQFCFRLASIAFAVGLLVAHLLDA